MHHYFFSNANASFIVVASPDSIRAIKRSNIITFNNKLKNGTAGISNIKYCDTYNSVIGSLQTSDGLHYASSTYNAIYSSMKSCGN